MVLVKLTEGFQGPQRFLIVVKIVSSLRIDLTRITVNCDNYEDGCYTVVRRQRVHVLL